MSKIGADLKKISERVHVGFSRFTLTYILTVVLFAAVTGVIFAGRNSGINVVDMFITVSLSCVPAMFFALGERLFFECRENSSGMLGRILEYAAIPVGVLFYILLGDLDDRYRVLAYIGLTSVLLIADILLMLALKKGDEREKVVPQIIKTVIFSGFSALLVFGGIEICLAAFNFLICEIEVFAELSFTLLAFAYTIVFVGLCLSGIPKKDEDIEIPKVFKVIVLYMLFPIYLLLIAVLYIYFVKILVTLKMPGGQLNWFASFAELFFIFFSYTLAQYAAEFKPVRIWQKFGGLVMIPIIVVQTVAVMIRYNAYGLTTPRLISMIFTVCAAVFIILSLISGGKYRHCAAVLLGVMIVIFTVTSANFYDLPTYDQTARLEKVLCEIGALEDGKLVKAQSITREQRQIIESCWDELRYEDKAPSYVDEYIDLDELFGALEKDTYEKNYFWYSFNTPEELDVSEYTHFSHFEHYYYFDEEDIDRMTVTVREKEYDLTDLILSITDEMAYNEFTAEIDGNLFVFNYVSYQLSDRSTEDKPIFTSYEYNGFVFSK